MYDYMENFCKEFNIKALNITEFVLFNKEIEETKQFKLDVLREDLVEHILACKTCKSSNQPERSKREDSLFVTTMAIGKAIKGQMKRCGALNTVETQ